MHVRTQADATLEMAERHFSQASLEYVFLLQEVQERKKFEFVETVIVERLYYSLKDYNYLFACT